MPRTGAFPTIIVAGGDSDALGDFALVEHPERGSRGLQGRRPSWTNAGGGLAHVIFRPPGRARAENRGDLLIRSGDQPLESVDLSREAGANRRVRQPPPMALSHQHPEELASSLQQRVKLLRRLVWKRAGHGAHRFGAVRDEPRIERVGLRQLAGRLGNITHLTRVPHGKRQLGNGEGGHPGALPAPPSLRARSA
jgi:hypothetical protein